jgi:hypothetical protein
MQLGVSIYLGRAFLYLSIYYLSIYLSKTCELARTRRCGKVGWRPLHARALFAPTPIPAPSPRRCRGRGPRVWRRRSPESHSGAQTC